MDPTPIFVKSKILKNGVTVRIKNGVTPIVLILLSASLIGSDEAFDADQCWWTGCQPRVWRHRGCYPQHQYIFVETRPCVSSIKYENRMGDLFYCCPFPPLETFGNNDLHNTLEESESGICSWYGGSEIPKGAITASGEKFNKFEMTAAHKTLPFGTRIQVKNMRTDQTVNVRINDRGPFIKGRILDLSFTAFGVLENRDKGLFPCSFAILTAF